MSNSVTTDSSSFKRRRLDGRLYSSESMSDRARLDVGNEGGSVEGGRDLRTFKIMSNNDTATSSDSSSEIGESGLNVDTKFVCFTCRR